MAKTIKELEREIRMLSSKEKAALARILIDELDSTVDENVEQLWIDEAQRRYQAFVNGELEARPGDEVMHGARRRLK